jgi:hypothetical protein
MLIHSKLIVFKKRTLRNKAIRNRLFRNKMKMMAALSFLALIRRFVGLTAILMLPFNLFSPGQTSFAQSEEAVAPSDILVVQQDRINDGAVLISAANAVNATASADEFAVTLSDITEHWAEGAIRDAVSLGFVSGYGDGTFKPDQALSLKELAVMLTTALTIPLLDDKQLSGSKQSTLQSVQDRHIQSLHDIGIIDGNEATPDKWEKPVSHGLLIKLALRTIDPAFAEKNREPQKDEVKKSGAEEEGRFEEEGNEVFEEKEDGKSGEQEVGRPGMQEDKKLEDYAIAAGLLDERNKQSGWTAVVATRAEAVVVLHRLREILGVKN